MWRKGAVSSSLVLLLMSLGNNLLWCSEPATSRGCSCTDTAHIVDPSRLQKSEKLVAIFPMSKGILEQCMKCPDAQSSSSHLWRSGGCCWIMKVFQRLAQGSMAHLCSRTGGLLLEALSWLLFVPHAETTDPPPSAFCGLSVVLCLVSLQRQPNMQHGCYLGFWPVLPEGVRWRAKLWAWDRGTASVGELARAWPEGTVLSTGPCSAHPRVLSFDMPQGRSSVSLHVAAVLAWGSASTWWALVWNPQLSSV